MANKLVEIIEKYDLNGFRPKYDERGRHLGGWGTDKNDWHSYCDYYEEALLPYVDKEVSVLEIGTNYGGSAILWYEYLKKSNLVLLDIDETIHPKIWEIFDNDRFVYANCDAYQESSAEEVKNIMTNGIDILFEDGPHTIESQLKTLDLYLDQLNPGGIIFIEDIQDFDYLEKLKNRLEEITEGDSNYRYEVENIDLRHIKDRYDDLIFVVKKFKIQ